MANNQITPFQLTDQFTMDNFNQRINETNTALQNKAPAGYGLGSISKFISSSDDLNDVVYDGWYYFDAPPINAPLLDGVNAVGYSSMLVSNRDPSLYVTQEIFCYATWEAFNCVLRRCRINGEWRPWEWVNPPMMTDIEYRTTDRHQGMPVYKKLVYFGVLSQDEKLVSVSVANIDKLLRIDAYDIGLEGSSGQTGIIPMVRPGFYINFGGWKTPNNVVLASNSNWSAITNWEAYAILSYTKTTD